MTEGKHRRELTETEREDRSVDALEWISMTFLALLAAATIAFILIGVDR